MMSSELHVLAKHLLLCYQGKSNLSGSVPSVEELAALLGDRLSFNRKQEVYAYLNSSPELFSMWIALVEASDNIKPLPEKKMFAFYLNKFVGLFSAYNLVTLSTSCAALIVLVFSVNYFTVKQAEPAWSVWYSASDKQSLDEKSLKDYIIKISSEMKAYCSDSKASEINYDDFYRVLVDIKNQFIINKITPPIELKKLEVVDFKDKDLMCDFNSLLLREIKK